MTPGVPIRFERHLGFASWAFLSKALPVAFGLAFLLLVVRVLPPEEFGLQALAATLVLVLAQMLRFLFLVPMTKFVAEGRETRQMATAGFLAYVGASTVVAICLFWGRQYWAQAFDMPELGPVLVPTAAMMLVGSGREACLANLEGHRLLRRYFVAESIYYGTAIAAILCWNLLDWPRQAVLVQSLQALAAGVGTVAALVIAHAWSWGRVLGRHLRRLWEFGRFSFLSAVADILRMQADTLLVGALMDAREVAIYSAAKLLSRILNLVAQTVSQIVMPAVSRLQAEDRRVELRVVFEKAVCFLGWSMLLFVSLAWWLTPAAFDLLYGGLYEESVPVFRLLLLLALTLPLATVGSSYLVGLGRVRSLVWITWVSLAVTLLAIAYWVPRWGASGAALAALMAAVVGMLTRTLVLRRMLSFRFRDILFRSADIYRFVVRLVNRFAIGKSRRN